METKLEENRFEMTKDQFHVLYKDNLTHTYFNKLNNIENCNGDCIVSKDCNMENLNTSETNLSKLHVTSKLPQSESNVQHNSSILMNMNSNNTEFDNNSDEEHSNYEAVVSQNCQEVVLTRDRPTSLALNTGKRRLLKISPEEISSPDSPLSDDIDKMLSTETDSHDDIEHSIIKHSDLVEKIPELTLEEERADSKNWKVCTINGIKKKIDMKVIEPYKCVLSHGGYLTTGSYNAIITFSACYLPHKSRVDYNYVMDNLFLYVLSALNQLITDDYVLVYLHGGTAKECIPTFSWLKKCYQIIDRKLKKNLKTLYLVHPTFWLKTLMLMIKPFISSKFSRKIQFINSLAELHEILPIEEASIPDKVKQYDRIKSSFANK